MKYVFAKICIQRAHQTLYYLQGTFVFASLSLWTGGDSAKYQKSCKLVVFVLDGQPFAKTYKVIKAFSSQLKVLTLYVHCVTKRKSWQVGDFSD